MSAAARELPMAIDRAPTRRTRTDWCEERLAVLRDLFDMGLSHELMAQALGLSKGAISAKLDRLAEQDPATWSRTATIIAIRPDRVAIAAEQRRVHEERRAAEAEAVGCTLLELGPGHCKWPLAYTDQWTFCGRPAGSGEAYCADHERRSRGPSAGGEQL